MPTSIPRASTTFLITDGPRVVSIFDRPLVHLLRVSLFIVFDNRLCWWPRSGIHENVHMDPYQLAQEPISGNLRAYSKLVSISNQDLKQNIFQHLDQNQLGFQMDVHGSRWACVMSTRSCVYIYIWQRAATGHHAIWHTMGRPYAISL